MEGLSFQDSSFDQNERSSSRRFVVVIAIVLLIGVGIFGATRLNLFSKKSNQAASVPTPVIEPTDEPTPTPEPTIPTPTGTAKTNPTTSSKVPPTPVKKPAVTPGKSSGLDKSKITIAIKNGSGETGVAQQASDVLKSFGYNVTSVGNADNFDYEKVTIQVKSGQEAYLTELRKDLSASYTIGSASATLSSSSSTDAIVIIGK